MNSGNYGNKLLTQYLLGTLSEAQVEECDELSIIDDDFAARLEDVENDLVDAYMRGELRGGDLKAFETSYLASPRRREKVVFAKSFQTFTEQQVVTAQAVAPITSETEEAESVRRIVEETTP